MEERNILKTNRFNATIVGTSIRTLEISKVSKSTSFILEQGRVISGMSCSGNKDWKSSVIGLKEIRLLANNAKGNQGSGGEFGRHILSIHSTSASRQIGENPTYHLIMALVDDAKISIDMHDVGSLLCIKAQELPMLVRKGGFLIGEQGIIIDRYALSGEDTRFMSELLGMSFFQAISGNGYFWIEIQGDLGTPIELFPGEQVLVDPLKLIAMSKSVHIQQAVTTSSDKRVRTATGKDYDILLQADARGGIVFLSSVPQQKHGTAIVKEDSK